MNSTQSKRRYAAQQPPALALRAGACARPPLHSESTQPSSLAADEDLFARYQQGDDRVFAEIVRRYEPQIQGFLRKRLKDEERVQDLTQDTFLRVHRARDRFDSSRKFSTWIYTIASNLLKNEFRNRSRRRETNFSDLASGDAAERNSRLVEFESGHPDPEQLAHRGELRRAIEDAMRRMDEHHRVPFEMREVEDRTYEEIAEALEVPVGTVKSRLFRARTAFQSLYPLPF